MRRDPGLQRDVFEQPALGRCERLVCGPRRHQQLADRLRLVDQRQRDGIAGGAAVRRGDHQPVAVLERQSDVGQLEGLRHSLHDVGQHCAGRAGRLELLA
ncbi:MAG TPA: hypothetical protein VNL77_08875 [Roseiflexaceae bacterium]|nr:hypothetical protein [Roseiflexaceae bacterium]